MQKKRRACHKGGKAAIQNCGRVDVLAMSIRAFLSDTLRKLGLHNSIICDKCGGRASKSSDKKCGNCYGFGFALYFYNGQPVEEVCKDCQGIGWFPVEINCKTCKRSEQCVEPTLHNQ